MGVTTVAKCHRAASRGTRCEEVVARTGGPGAGSVVGMSQGGPHTAKGGVGTNGPAPKPTRCARVSRAVRRSIRREGNSVMWA